MPYNEDLAARVRKLIRRRKGYSERKMFGAMSFMLNGNMCCGVIGDDLMIRLGEERAAAARKKRHTREMDFTGKSMKGMLYVEPAGTKTDAALKKWVDQAIAAAKTLPPK